MKCNKIVWSIDNPWIHKDKYEVIRLNKHFYYPEEPHFIKNTGLSYENQAVVLQKQKTKCVV